MSKSKTLKTVVPATLSIEEVFKEFLADQEKRLKPKTIRKYKEVIDLFEDCLNGYAYQSLDKKESALFDRLYEAKGESHREFCQIFGPEKIPENVGEFLNYFMVRKVFGGKELKQAAGTVMKKLAKWLREKGYIQPEEAEEVVERGGGAAQELSAAEELTQRLAAYADETAPRCEEVIEDYFTIKAVEPGKLRLSDLSGGEDVLVPIPRSLSNLCRVGWEICGTIGKTDKGWRLLEVWNVYP